MTHDSIGLGEDGPTHQPVEHLAALRAIPNLLVFRPADAVETAECWELALRARDGPVGPGPDAPEPADAAHRAATRTCAPAAPTCWPRPSGQRDADHPRHRLGGASGAGGARAARQRRHRRGAWSRCRAGSCSSRQDRAYRAAVLGTAPAARGRGRRSPSAGRATSPSEADVVGMRGFGASAPAKDLLPAFRHHRRGGGRAGPSRLARRAAA